jgi:hypothetical protein
MQRYSARLYLTRVVLLGLLLNAPTLLIAKAEGTLRLNLEGPFVICEDVENKVPILRVMAPIDNDHYNPGFSADSSWYPKDPPVGDVELKAKNGRYSVKISHKSPKKVRPDGDLILDSLTRNDNSCKAGGSVFLTVTLPMPDHIRPFAPVRVDSDFTPAPSPPPLCDDKEAALNSNKKDYGTKLALIYDDVDVDKITIDDDCPNGDCTKSIMVFQPKIDLVSGVGVLVLHRLQKTADPEDDHHHYAKHVHESMRTIAGALNHCVHFEKDSLAADASRKVPANIEYSGHTDCHAPLIFVCAKSSSVVCGQ